MYKAAIEGTTPDAPGVPDEPTAIPAWQRLGPALTTSGRLREEDIASLAALGVRHVINLALDDSPGALAGEEALLAARGIGYSHIPVPFEAPDDAHFAAFEAALARATRPVHVHCMMNWRVAAFFYRHHRGAGMPEAEARALMARQWQPETSDSPQAGVWARFIAGI